MSIEVSNIGRSGASLFGFRNKPYPKSQDSLRSGCELERFALDAGLFLMDGFNSPCHAGSIVIDADLACGIQNDDSAVPIQPLFQVVHGFLRGPFR